MQEHVIFVENLVMVHDRESEKVASNIIEMLDGESLETLTEIEKMLQYYFKAKANQDTIHRSLSAILYNNNEKNN